MEAADPLFWIHLKIDHPFTLEGVLYFPKLNPLRPFSEKNIRLYCKQVFVSDNVKDIIPEFLSLLKGAVDSADIPLNVSRSSLQGDPNVKKIAGYISKKAAESLKKLFKSDRKKYEEIWPDIGFFVKYGIISDPKFHDLMLPFVLFKGNGEKFFTLEEYKESIPEEYKEKMKDKAIYFEREHSDYALREQLKENGIETIETDDYIDHHFMQHLEVKEKLKFGSVESEIHQLFEAEETAADDIKVKEFFEKALSAKEVELKKIKNISTPAYFKTDEQMRRFQKMSQSMGQGDSFTPKRTLVINPGNPLVQNAFKMHEKGHKGLADKICHHIEDLASISGEGLKNEEKDRFVKRGQELLSELSELAVQ